eukprot:147231_1
MPDKLVEALRFNHNLQSILDDPLIDNKTSQELILLNIQNIIQELGLLFLKKLLFNGLKESLRAINYESLLKIKDGSDKILETQKQKYKDKSEESVTDNDNTQFFSFENTPDDLLYYMSEFLSLEEAINLQLLNHTMFYCFRAIPSYDKNQINENYMQWFNNDIINNCNNGHNILLPLKFKFITDFNLKHIPLEYNQDNNDDDEDEDIKEQDNEQEQSL